MWMWVWCHVTSVMWPVNSLPHAAFVAPSRSLWLFPSPAHGCASTGGTGRQRERLAAPKHTGSTSGILSVSCQELMHVTLLDLFFFVCAPPTHTHTAFSLSISRSLPLSPSFHALPADEKQCCARVCDSNLKLLMCCLSLPMVPIHTHTHTPSLGQGHLHHKCTSTCTDRHWCSWYYDE